MNELNPSKSIMVFGPEVLSPREGGSCDHYGNPYVTALLNCIRNEHDNNQVDELNGNVLELDKETRNRIINILSAPKNKEPNLSPLYDRCPLHSLPLIFSEIGACLQSCRDFEKLKRMWVERVNIHLDCARPELLVRIARSGFNVFVTTLVDRSLFEAFASVGRTPRTFHLLVENDVSQLEKEFQKLEPRTNGERKFELIDPYTPIVVSLFGSPDDNLFVVSEREVISWSLIFAEKFQRLSTTLSVMENSPVFISGLGMHRWFQRLLLGVLGILPVPRDQTKIFPQKKFSYERHLHILEDSLHSPYDQCTRQAHLANWLNKEFNVSLPLDKMTEVLDRPGLTPVVARMAQEIFSKINVPGSPKKKKLFFCHSSDDAILVRAVYYQVKKLAQTNGCELNDVDVFIDLTSIGLEAPRAKCTEFINEHGQEEGFCFLLFVGKSQIEFTSSSDSERKIRSQKSWPLEVEVQKFKSTANIVCVQCDRFDLDEATDKNVFFNSANLLCGVKSIDYAPFCIRAF